MPGKNDPRKLAVQEEVRDLILGGWLREEIIREIKRLHEGEEPPLKLRSLSRWVDEVFEQVQGLDVDLRKEKGQFLGVGLQRLEFLYRQAVKRGDIKEAHRIVMSQFEVRGLRGSKNSVQVLNIQQSGGASGPPAPGSGGEDYQSLVEEAHQLGLPVPDDIPFADQIGMASKQAAQQGQVLVITPEHAKHLEGSGG